SLPLEWGSGGRWFESSRPDTASLAVTTGASTRQGRRRLHRAASNPSTDSTVSSGHNGLMMWTILTNSPESTFGPTPWSYGPFDAPLMGPARLRRYRALIRTPYA